MIFVRPQINRMKKHQLFELKPNGILKKKMKKLKNEKRQILLKSFIIRKMIADFHALILDSSVQSIFVGKKV